VQTTAEEPDPNRDPDSPKTVTTLKAWHRRLSANVQSAVDTIAKSASMLSSPVLSTARPHTPMTPLTPEPSLWLSKTLGVSDSADQYTNAETVITVVPAEDTLNWKIFSRMLESDAKLGHEQCFAFAQRLSDGHEWEKALVALGVIPSHQWTLETYKLAIYLHLSKKPKDVPMSNKLLNQYSTSSIPVRACNDESTIDMKYLLDCDYCKRWHHCN